MRLVWHIVLKDLRRLGAPLACWAILLITKNEVGVWAGRHDSVTIDDLSIFELMEYTLLALDMIVCALLTAQLVQEDGLVGSDNFWVTRPVGGVRLLAAKLLSATLMFGLVPLVVSLRWWIVCGYDAGQMAHAALAVLDGQFVLVSVSLVLAAFTPNIGQFLAAVIGACVAFVLSGTLTRVMSQELQTDLTHGADETSRLLVPPLFVLGGAGALAVQFIQRRRWRGVGLMAVAVILGLISSAGRWDLSRFWTPAPRTAPQAAGIKIGVSGEVESQRNQVRVKYTVHGVPEDFATRVAADHEWRWADGRQAYWHSDFASGTWPGPAEWLALGLKGKFPELARTAYLGGPNFPTADLRNTGLSFMTEGWHAHRLGREPAAYRGDVHVTLWRPKIDWELPLSGGAQAHSDGSSLRLVSTAWADGEVRISLVSSTPNWTRYGRYRPALVNQFYRADHPSESIVLVNRERGEAVRLWGFEGKNNSLIVGTQELWWPSVNGIIPREADEAKDGARPRWLDGAKLVVLRYEEEVRFDREIKAEPFPVLPATP